MVDIKTVLTENELITRKIWLSLFLIFTSICYVSTSTMLYLFEFIPPIAYSKYDLLFGLLLNGVWFYFCYLKPGTILLTISIIGAIISYAVICLVNLVILNAFGLGIFLYTTSMCTILAAITFFPFLITVQMRKINRFLRCYKKYPQELCDSAANHIRAAENLEQVECLYNEGLEKWPKLKPLLERERDLKKKQLSA